LLDELFEASEAVGLGCVEVDGEGGVAGVVGDEVVGEEREGGPTVVADHHGGR
jgi:hypothetical protein